MLKTIMLAEGTGFPPSLLIGIIVVVVLLFSLLLVCLTRYRRCPSDKVMVIYGRVGQNKDGTSRSARCIHGLSLIHIYIGYVLLIPIGALVFMAYGRHPLAGLAAAFAGVSGGFSANLLIGALDPLLAGISTEAAGIIAPGYNVLATCNWYFMIASTFLIVLIGTLVTDKIVEPRLGKYQPRQAEGEGLTEMCIRDRSTISLPISRRVTSIQPSIL